MSTRVTERKLKENLSDFLDRAETGEECVIRRRGKDSVVLVSAADWNMGLLGRRLDALGSDYRLSKDKQQRLERLAAKNSNDKLTKVERHEFDELLAEGDEIMARRASSLKRLA